MHTVIHFHLIRLHPFLGGILSLWRQKSNRSNNIRCALTSVHWESGLVTAHASIAGYNCEAAHKCSRLRHSLARAQQLREARSITGKVTPCMVIHQLSWQMQDSGHHHIWKLSVSNQIIHLIFSGMKKLQSCNSENWDLLLFANALAVCLSFAWYLHPLGTLVCWQSRLLVNCWGREIARGATVAPGNSSTYLVSCPSLDDLCINSWILSQNPDDRGTG